MRGREQQHQPQRGTGQRQYDDGLHPRHQEEQEEEVNGEESELCPGPLPEQALRLREGKFPRTPPTQTRSPRLFSAFLDTDPSDAIRAPPLQDQEHFNEEEGEAEVKSKKSKAKSVFGFDTTNMFSALQSPSGSERSMSSAGVSLKSADSAVSVDDVPEVSSKEIEEEQTPHARSQARPEQHRLLPRAFSFSSTPTP